MDVNLKLAKLIMDNPDLPVMIFAENDIDLDYDYSANKLRNCEIDELTLYDNCYYNQDELHDHLAEYILCDHSDFKDLSDKDYDDAVDKYIEDNFIFNQYIVIYSNNC